MGIETDVAAFGKHRDFALSDNAAQLALTKPELLSNLGQGEIVTHCPLPAICDRFRRVDVPADVSRSACRI
jgi:pyrrolidone-carboxylate peptidase